MTRSVRAGAVVLAAAAAGFVAALVSGPGPPARAQGDTLLETITVNVDPDGPYEQFQPLSATTLSAGTTYRLEASGTWKTGSGGQVFDHDSVYCFGSNGTPSCNPPQEYLTRLIGRYEGGNYGYFYNVFSGGSAPPYNVSHVYSVTFTAAESKRLQFSAAFPNSVDDMEGTVTVQLYEVAPSPSPPPPDTGTTETTTGGTAPQDTTPVDCSDAGPKGGTAARAAGAGAAGTDWWCHTVYHRLRMGSGVSTPPLPSAMRSGAVTVGNAAGGVVLGEGSIRDRRTKKELADAVGELVAYCFLVSEEPIDRLIDASESSQGKRVTGEEIDDFLKAPTAARAVLSACLDIVAGLLDKAVGKGTGARSAQAGGCHVQRVAIRVSRRKGRRARAQVIRPGRARGVRYTCRQAAAGELGFRVTAPGKRPLRSHVGSRLDLGFLTPRGTAPAAGDPTFFFSDGRRRVSFAGTWKTKYGNVTFEQHGAAVRGTSDYKAGRFTGTVTGTVLRGTWSQAPDYKAPRNAGAFTFTMNASGDAFSGTWRYGTSGDVFKDWSGVRG